MAFTSVEILALVLLVAAALKMLVFSISPKFYITFVKKISKRKAILQVVFLVLAVIVFSYLIRVFTLVEIFAVATFIALLLGIGFSNSMEKIISEYSKNIQDRKLFKIYWLYILIWLALMVGVIIELFF